VLLVSELSGIMVVGEVRLVSELELEKMVTGEEVRLSGVTRRLELVDNALTGGAISQDTVVETISCVACEPSIMAKGECLAVAVMRLDRDLVGGLTGSNSILDREVMFSVPAIECVEGDSGNVSLSDLAGWPGVRAVESCITVETEPSTGKSDDPPKIMEEVGMVSKEVVMLGFAVLGQEGITAEVSKVIVVVTVLEVSEEGKRGTSVAVMFLLVGEFWRLAVVATSNHNRMAGVIVVTMTMATCFV
jgi:hypothetical protein